MPVGRVFNAAQNQVLISPVSSYYEGKAKRASLKQAEANLEFTELRSKALKASMGPDTSEKTRLELEELRLNVQKKREELGDDEMQRRANAYGPIMEEAARMAEAGDLDGGIEYANNELRVAAEKLGPDVLAEFNEDLGEDRALNQTELKRIRSSILAYYEMAGVGGRQRDDEIRDAEAILIRMGVPNSHEEAIKQVDKLVKYTPDPAGGKLYKTDMLTDTTTEVDIQPSEPQGPPPTVPYNETLWALSEEATGVGPGAKEFLSKALGPIGGYVSEATISAKSKFKAAENTLIRAFALNPRYPVAEQQRIKENIQVKPKFWDSADLMRSRMRGIRAFLEQERVTAAYESKRKGIDRATRTKEENTVADIARYLRLLGQPQTSTGFRVISRRSAE